MPTMRKAQSESTIRFSFMNVHEANTEVTNSPNTKSSILQNLDNKIRGSTGLDQYSKISDKSYTNDTADYAVLGPPICLEGQHRAAKKASKLTVKMS